MAYRKLGRDSAHRKALLLLKPVLKKSVKLPKR